LGVTKVADERIIEVAEGPSISSKLGEGVERHASAIRLPVSYGIKVWIERPYERVLATVKEKLLQEGLVIAYEADVRKFVYNLSGANFPHYTILGVWHPTWANQALHIDLDCGLLLQCGLVVYEQPNGTVVEAVDPIVLFAIPGGADLQELARSVKMKLEDVVDHVFALLD